MQAAVRITYWQPSEQSPILSAVCYQRRGEIYCLVQFVEIKEVRKAKFR
jgi:hypothetical protein